MLRAAADTSSAPGRVLDLGTGCGIVGIAAARMRVAEEPVCASDLSERAVELARRNAQDLGVRIDARVGPLLDPWLGERFDLIIDDVSGVAEDIADLSPWFDGVPHATGSGGGDLTVEVLRRAPAHLGEGGALLIPLISLSDVATIAAVARATYEQVEQVVTQRWELPREMSPHIDQLRRARSEGRVDFEERFGMILCYTSIFRCTDPKA